MKIFKIYGKTGIGLDVTGETIKIVERSKAADDLTLFIDVDTVEGYEEALSSNIFILPAVSCQNSITYEEMGFIENEASIDKDTGYDINKSDRWWKELEEFMESMKEIDV